jgi:hypothetical protein
MTSQSDLDETSSAEQQELFELLLKQDSADVSDKPIPRKTSSSATTLSDVQEHVSQHLSQERDPPLLRLLTDSAGGRTSGEASDS